MTQPVIFVGIYGYIKVLDVKRTFLEVMFKCSTKL